MSSQKLEHYARQYGERKLSSPAPREKAGASVWEFQEYTTTRRIPSQYDQTDLEHDLRIIEKQ